MSENIYEHIKERSRTAAAELLERAALNPGDIFVVGCSSSEIAGSRIGTSSSADAARAVLDGIYPLLRERGIYIAAQCCEHLNRALIIEREAADKYGYNIVNAVPQPGAGGAFAAAVYAALGRPVAVEHIRAHAGMDIGGTLIGMHLREVAVPVRLSVSKIGEASLICARTRPKFIGGVRAAYDDNLM